MVRSADFGKAVTFLNGVSKTWFDLVPLHKVLVNFSTRVFGGISAKEKSRRLLSEAVEFSSVQCNTHETYIIQKTGMLRNISKLESDIPELILHWTKEKEVQITANNLNFEKLSDL